MLMTGIFGENLFDEWMDASFPRAKGGSVQNIMKTDVKETDQGYEIDMELPGFKKEDVRIQLKDGYLAIQASQDVNRDRKDSEGKYIRRERFLGSVSRSFYVGDQVTEEDIHAAFEDGILKLSLPKADKNHYIAIEG